MTDMTAGGSWWVRARQRLAQPGTSADYMAPDRLDRHARALQSGAVLLIVFLVAFALNLFKDGDTGWHLGAGHWIVEHRAVPMVDPFSHTQPGKAWTAHEWLAELLMVAGEWLDGWAGIVMVFALSMAITIWLVAREAFRRLPARWALVALCILMAMLMPSIHARPHMMAWPLLAAWTLILLRAREKNQAPPLAAALLMVIWANLHASYIVAFGIAGLFGLESLIHNLKDRKLLARWILFGLTSLAAAALVTPFGPSHFLYPFEVSGMEALSIIGEWRRSTPLSDPLFFLCLALLGLFLIKRWRTIPPLRLLLLLGLSAMALMHVRHQMLFAIVGGLVVLSLIAPAAATKPALPRTAWLVPGLLLILVARFLVPFEFKESPTFPLTLLSKVPAEIKALPVYNEYSQGGPLVMLGVRPYIDGRADMYGDDHTFRARAITRGDMPKFREDVARYGIRWVLLRQDNKLTNKLRKEPGWRLFAEDEHAVVFIASR